MTATNEKLLSLLLALLMLLSLAGCGKDEQERPVIENVEVDSDVTQLPVMEAVDIERIMRFKIDDGEISYHVPAVSWLEGTNANGETVVLFRETADSEQQVSARAKLVGFYGSGLDQKFMDAVVSSLNDDLSLTVTTSEMRSFQNAPIFYAEMTVEFTDEVIDKLLEQEIWTQEQLDAAGGREYYTSIPKTNTIMIYAEVDGYMVTYGGSYYDDAQKKIVLNAINIMLQTTEILE